MTDTGQENGRTVGDGPPPSSFACRARPHTVDCRHMNVTAVSRDEYAALLHQAAVRGLSCWRAELERWREGAGFSALWGYNPPGDPLITAGALRTDAHFAHVRLHAGVPVSWSAVVVGGVEWDGKPLFQAPLNTFGLQPDGAADRDSRPRWRAWESES